MSPLETLPRSRGEDIVFVSFFLTIAGLALLETRAAMRTQGVDRRHRWPTNAAMTALNIVVMGAIPLSGLAMADLARDRGWGLLNAFAPDPWLGIAASFLVCSLQSWALHLAMHKVPLLWRMHRVHHSDTHLDVSTTVRFHPLELALQAPVGAVMILALGAPPAAVLLYGIFDALVNAFSHANLRLPDRLDRGLGWVIVTPHLHRVHHSPDQPETDSNFGATLPHWDRLFGTFRCKTPEALAAQEIGLHEMQDRRGSSLVWALTLPFRSILRDTSGDTPGARHER